MYFYVSVFTVATKTRHFKKYLDWYLPSSPFQISFFKSLLEKRVIRHFTQSHSRNSRLPFQQSCLCLKWKAFLRPPVNHWIAFQLSSDPQSHFTPKRTLSVLRHPNTWRSQKIFIDEPRMYERLLLLSSRKCLFLEFFQKSGFLMR